MLITFGVAVAIARAVAVAVVGSLFAVRKPSVCLLEIGSIVIGSRAFGGCMESIAPECMGLFALENERYTMSVESDVYSLGHLVLQGVRAQNEELLSREVGHGMVLAYLLSVCLSVCL